MNIRTLYKDSNVLIFELTIKSKKPERMSVVKSKDGTTLFATNSDKRKLNKKFFDKIKGFIEKEFNKKLDIKTKFTLT